MMDAEALDATPSQSSPSPDPKGDTTMTDQTVPVDKLRALLDGEGSAADKIQAIYDDLLPAPLPDPLFGAWATHPEHGEGIVISHFPDDDGTVRFIFPGKGMGDGTNVRWVPLSDLTFHTPDHPEFLETEEDYRNAPEGTIVAEDTVVAEDDAVPAVLVDGLWRFADSWTFYHEEMAGVRRRVLRWGWEA